MERLITRKSRSIELSLSPKGHCLGFTFSGVAAWSGLSKESLHGLRWVRCVHPDDHPSLYDLWHLAIQSHVPRSAECRFLVKDAWEAVRLVFYPRWSSGNGLEKIDLIIKPEPLLDEKPRGSSPQPALGLSPELIRQFLRAQTESELAESPRKRFPLREDLRPKLTPFDEALLQDLQEVGWGRHQEQSPEKTRPSIVVMASLVLAMAVAMFSLYSLVVRTPEAVSPVASGEGAPETFELEISHNRDRAHSGLSSTEFAEIVPAYGFEIPGHRQTQGPFDHPWIAKATEQMEEFLLGKGLAAKLRYVDQPKSAEVFIRRHLACSPAIEEVGLRVIQTGTSGEGGGHNRFPTFQIRTDVNPHGFLLTPRFESSRIHIPWQRFIQFHEDHFTSFWLDKVSRPARFFLQIKAAPDGLLSPPEGFIPCLVSGSRPDRWCPAFFNSDSTLRHRLTNAGSPLKIRARLIRKQVQPGLGKLLMLNEVMAFDWDGDVYGVPDHVPFYERAILPAITHAEAETVFQLFKNSPDMDERKAQLIQQPAYPGLSYHGSPTMANSVLLRMPLLPRDTRQGVAGFFVCSSTPQDPWSPTLAAGSQASAIAWFKRSKDGIRLDWATYRQTNDRLWEVFLKFPTSVPQVFRLLCSRIQGEPNTVMMRDPLHGLPQRVRTIPEDGIDEGLVDLPGRTATVELVWKQGELWLKRLICWEYLNVLGSH